MRIHGHADPTTSIREYAAAGALAASAAVVISRSCVAMQVRHAMRVSQDEARHQLSAFAFERSRFHTEHADRLVRVHGPGELSEGDQQFRWWNHMMVFLHAETCYRRRELGPMPDSYREGHRRFVRGYLAKPGAGPFWADLGPAFAREFSGWITPPPAEKTAAVGGALPPETGRE